MLNLVRSWIIYFMTLKFLHISWRPEQSHREMKTTDWGLLAGDSENPVGGYHGSQERYHVQRGNHCRLRRPQNLRQLKSTARGSRLATCNSVGVTNRQHCASLQVVVMLLLMVAVALCLPSDADPADPDSDSGYSPTDVSGTVLKKKKLKKLLLLG